jgi:Cu2+-exporting ATPase
MMFGLGLNRVRVNQATTAPAKAADPCFHCGLPVPDPVADWLLFDGERRPMCCAACLAAADMIIGAGFAGHYRARTVSASVDGGR